MLKQTERAALAGFTLCLVLMAAGCGRQHRDSTRTTGHRQHEPFHSPIAVALPRRLVEQFPIFLTRAESPPAPVIAKVSRQDKHLRWRSSQLFYATWRGESYWALPEAGHVCVLRQALKEGLSMTCTTMKRAVEHGVAIVTLNGAPGNPEKRLGRTIVGLMPKRAVRVRIVTGRYATTAVLHKSVLAEIDARSEPPDYLQPLPR